MHSNSPPYRQNSYPPQNVPPNQYYQNQQHYGGPHSQHNQHGFQQPPFRGSHGPSRGGHFQQGADRRLFGPGPGPTPGPQNFTPPNRGRGGHFSNLQWTAPGTKRGGGQTQNFPSSHQGSMHTSPALSHQASRESLTSAIGDDDNPFRPSKDLQVEDEKKETRGPPSGKQQGNAQQKDASKFSFAFKSKAPPTAPAKPPPDLNSKMKHPPPTRPPEFSDTRHHQPSNPKQRPDARYDRRDDRRDNRRDDRRDDRIRHDYRDDRRSREDHRPDHRNDRRPARSRSPSNKKAKKTIKPRPTLTPEMAASESVYFRKPGNESVVGAGTYGKVFKAIHIYTKDKVALKKIRMEGERDGFPITAVREIRLLQHLRHKHVVALQEVMVEKNECFMVFEYLSHDLTGLINHPTFQLTGAHRKHLAQQMFDGLDFMHQRGVLHRDIKAANILISNTGQLKFADFGLARFYTKSRQLDYTNRVITIWYRPPELLLGETQYGPAVDIWSAACVFVEMFTKKAVFPGEGGELSQLEKVYNVLGTPTRNDWPNIVEMPWFELMQPTDRRRRIFEEMFKEVFTPAALEMVKSMFRYDPAKRPSAEEVLAHPYFTAEEPGAVQAVELKNVHGDWHEFESKAHRRENERREKEKKKEEHQREKEKRKAAAAGIGGEPQAKKQRPDSGEGESGSKPATS